MLIIRAMDELLIEDKRYVSSKRAAQMTGYAKDYIGQLCREGRVPARLVGRSWYVLETAIQDHRFGTADIQPMEPIKEPSPTVLPSTWEPPRYEASSDDLLPSVNRLRTTESAVTVNGADQHDEPVATESLQDSWKAWFDHVANTEIETMVPVVIEEKPINVPIHAIYKQPPEELLPRSVHLEIEPSSPEVVSKVSNRGIMAIQVFSIISAIVTATLAVVGTGYLDEYVISSSQVRIIAGVGLYNK